MADAERLKDHETRSFTAKRHARSLHRQRANLGRPVELAPIEFQGSTGFSKPVVLIDRSSPDYYLHLPPGAVFIGREPTTIATESDIVQARSERLRGLRERLGVEGAVRRLREADLPGAVRMTQIAGLQKPA